MENFNSVLLKIITYFTSESVEDKYAHLLGVRHQYNKNLNEHILYSQDLYGSGSGYNLQSIALLDCNPVSFADNNAPTVNIDQSQANLLMTASAHNDTETILHWCESNYFYHESSPATSSVEIINDVNHWLLSGSVANNILNNQIGTFPAFDTGSI